MIPDVNPKCAQCNHPSKKLAAYADGYDEKGKHIGVKAYTCSNATCPIANDRCINELKESIRKEAVAKVNLDAGRDFSRVEAARMANRVILGNAAAILGISPVDYCKYRGNEEPVPADVWERCLLLLAVYEGEGEKYDR